MSSSLLELYYQHIERPALLRPQAGERAMPCPVNQAALPDKAPRACDIAVVATASDGSVVESFYFTDASRLSNVSRDGMWIRTSSECTAASRLLNVALLGFAFIGVAVVGHSSRTGQWFTYPGAKREPMNDFETVFAIYGATIFGGQVLATASASCAALALN